MIIISKTKTTKELERDIFYATKAQGVFGCFEVTIGWYGKERVDYMTYDTKGIFRCYEVKVSKSDFRSNAHHTFCGHYNYYVMTQELFEQVKAEIPPHIGVYVGRCCFKNAKKQELTVDVHVLKDSMIRSLYRDVDKAMEAHEIEFVKYLKDEIKRSDKYAKRVEEKYHNLFNTVYHKMGKEWVSDNISLDCLC